MKKKLVKIIKWTFISVITLVIILISFGAWIKSLVPPRNIELEKTMVVDLPYLNENITEHRGKILAVVTSIDTMKNSKTGYELTELARAYYVFKANGFEVDVASPLGGKPPVVIDDEDMGVFDYAFLNDTIAQYKTNHSLAIENVNPTAYEAVYFVGGKGAMFDFPNNKKIQAIIREYYQSNKVIGAVCHGPAALVNVDLADGRPLLANKTVSSFTNKEELMLIPDAKTVFPFLLQDELTAKGARFNEGKMYLSQISHDDNLITGQNPWSVWEVAETMIQQLGYSPKHRAITDEEHAVAILHTYETQGSDAARTLVKQLIQDKKQPVSRLLIAKHSILAAMKGDIGRFIDIIRLTSYTKKLSE